MENLQNTMHCSLFLPVSSNGSFFSSLSLDDYDSDSSLLYSELDWARGLLASSSGIMLELFTLLSKKDLERSLSVPSLKFNYLFNRSVVILWVGF